MQLHWPRSAPDSCSAGPATKSQLFTTVISKPPLQEARISVSYQLLEMPKRIIAGTVGVIALVSCFFASVHAILAIEDAHSTDVSALPWWAIAAELLMCSMALATLVIGFPVPRFCVDRSQSWRWGALVQAGASGLWIILSRFRCFISGGTQLGIPHVAREPRPKRARRFEDQSLPWRCGSSHRLWSAAPKGTAMTE
jgi:hypothetical protein